LKPLGSIATGMHSAGPRNGPLDGGYRSRNDLPPGIGAWPYGKADRGRFAGPLGDASAWL